MKKVLFLFRTWTALVCVAMARMWLSDASVAEVITFDSGTNAFDMEFVAIGNPGNADDTTGDPNPAGKADYVYQMGMFEVSENMITIVQCFTVVADHSRSQRTRAGPISRQPV